MILANIRSHKIIFIHLVPVSRVVGEYLQFDLLHSLCICQFVSSCCCCVDIVAAIMIQMPRDLAG